MNAAEIKIKLAHASAGHIAYAIVQENGVDIGGAMLGAYARAFVLAYAATEGWEAADKLLAEIARIGKPGPIRSTPHLRLVNQ